MSGYNGWTNYETWRVNLEICDDLLQSMDADGEKFADTFDLAARLREEVEEAVSGYGEIPEGSIAYQYAMAFIDGVNYHQIARNWEDELIEQEEAEDAGATIR